ncbi:1-acyl-sn-glycerol-3-phosphate acyltransferase [Ferruginibacter albus]|nr:1-acyl-sn-glycerol-3-phosphate acyltransferase [Ferruginibacter albus]
MRYKGPLLIAANHSNSFLDAVILATLFEQPIYSLARGDVFVNSFYTKLLTSVNILPVYRISEGAENLHRNYSTFNACEKIFQHNGIVLIFSEGSCSNEWHLRPLKKGTARLALQCWEAGIPLKVLPTGINYNSFTTFGKIIELDFGNIITEKDIDTDNSHGKSIASFNTILQTELQPAVIEISTTDKASIKKYFSYKVSLLKKIILAIPALLGFIAHAPLYFPIKKIAYNKGKATHPDHYDSFLVFLLFFSYPFYLVLIGLLVYWIVGGVWCISVLLLPFFAWSCLQLKNN